MAYLNIKAILIIKKPVHTAYLCLVDLKDTPQQQGKADNQIFELICYHTYLREIDYSLVVVGRLATAYSHGAESLHWPRKQCQSVFYCGWQHNYYYQ